MESVDSATFFDGDDYDDYDDFQANTGKGGGNAKIEKRQQDRGGGGSGNVYSSKHIRMKETQTKSKTPPKLK